MHKSSERSDNGCVWNEDAPTVVSCAFFRLSEPVVIFNRRLFCVPPYRSDGKDTAMKSNKETQERVQSQPYLLSHCGRQVLLLRTLGR